MRTHPDRHPARRPRGTVTGPPAGTRAGRGEVDPYPLVQWIGWHLGELAGVTVPAVLAVLVWPWFGLVTVLVGLAWLTHEVRLARRRRALTTAGQRALITASPADQRDGRDGQASA